MSIFTLLPVIALTAQMSILFPALCRPEADSAVEQMASLIAPSSSSFQSKGPTSERSNKWMIVPEWLAGTWQAQSEIVMDAYDFQHQNSKLDHPTSVKITRTSVIGMQRDRLGRIWHFLGTPYTRTIDAGAYIECQRMENISPQKVTPFEVIVNCTATVMHVDKRNGDLIAEFKEETMTSYVPLKDGLIQVNFSIKDYDLRGVELFSSNKVCMETKIRPFQVDDYDRERGELKLRFKQFLTDNGLGEIVP